MDARSQAYIRKCLEALGVLDWETRPDDPGDAAGELVQVDIFRQPVLRLGKGVAARRRETPDGQVWDVVRFVPNGRTFRLHEALELLRILDRFARQEPPLEPVFRCADCGREAHWLDLPGPIFRKFQALLEGRCGCSREE